MNTYQHVAHVTREVHEGMMRWARRVLQEAGYDTVEVYGQFPPKGVVSSHIVLFPYRVGPEPKMMETSTGASLLKYRERNVEKNPFVPDEWAELGGAVSACMEAIYPETRPPEGRAPVVRDPNPFPLLTSLPAPLRTWYDRSPKTEEGEPWVLEGNGVRMARPPSLWWRPGLTITARYIAIANEPGRGTEERTSASPPIALSALSVLSTGIQLERTLEVPLPPLPFDPELSRFLLALADAVESVDTGDGARKEAAARVRTALAACEAPSTAQVALLPVHDLTNHEFALLMQALQRPLQAALNLQIRLTLGSGPVFAPTAWVQVHPKNVGRPPLPPPREQAS